MGKLVAGMAMAALAAGAQGQSVNFDRDTAGALPAEWSAGVTGRGAARWAVEPDALENNVSLYTTGNGRRKTVQYVDAPVAGNVWQVLRAEFQGTKIRVLLNGKTLISVDDAHIKGPGAVGVWTKAGSVTAFDDFAYGLAPK